MTDLYERIVSQRSSFEELMTQVPGYRGYKDASDRRAADRMIREHIVGLLKEQMARLNEIDRKILTSGGLSEAGKTHEARLKFQTFIDRVNTATPGYAGFYDAQKIGPDELAKIYSFDAALVAYVNKFREAIDALDAAVANKDTLPGAIAQLEALGTEANAAYDLRSNVLTEIA